MGRDESPIMFILQWQEISCKMSVYKGTCVNRLQSHFLHFVASTIRSAQHHR